MNTPKDMITVHSAAVIGPMRSGKSATLLRWIHQFQEAGLRVQAFKPEIDSRDGAFVTSREKSLPINNFPAYTIQKTKQIISDLEAQENKGNSSITRFYACSDA
jgi:thymidine kinase